MATDATRYREDFDQNGLSPTHKHILAWVPRGSRVLEVGCSSGYIGKLLMTQKDCTVAGVEIDPNAAREARNNGLRVYEGSLEEPTFRESIRERYDIILATDVLEHLREPAPVLNHFKRWLAPGGRAIIAVPNIATWQIRKQLMLRGDWEYQESGILDRTHVHFFTWITLHKLVRDQGWDVVDTKVEWDLPLGRRPLLDKPQEAVRTVEKIATWGAGGRMAGAILRPCAAAFERTGRKLTERIYQRWPNVCASHISLMLSTPTLD